jgi:hypothetical protein
MGSNIASANAIGDGRVGGVNCPPFTQPEHRGDTPMINQTHNSAFRRLTITTAVSALLGLGVIASGVQAAQSSAQSSGVEAPMMLAATEGMDRRGERRDDRQDDRGDRRDTRQDCRGDEGVGKDKRDCKQDGREERREGDDNEGGDDNDKGGDDNDEASTEQG